MVREKFHWDSFTTTIHYKHQLWGILAKKRAWGIEPHMNSNSSNSTEDSANDIEILGDKNTDMQEIVSIMKHKWQRYNMNEL